MSDKLCTIIIPIMNTDIKLVKRCIDSVYKQTYSNIEVFVCLNGCTEEYHIQLRNELSTFKYVELYTENPGVSGARNLGINNARGEYLMFVDADDEIDDCFLEKGIRFLENDSLDLVSAGILRIYKNNTEEMVYKGDRPDVFCIDDLMGNIFFPEQVKDNESLKNYYLTSPCAKVYKTSIIGDTRFDLRLHHIEDMTFNLEILLKCNRVGLIPYCGYMYYQYKDSAIHTYDERMVANNFVMVDELYRLSKVDLNYRTHETLYIRFCIKMIWESIEHTANYHYWRGYVNCTYASNTYKFLCDGYNRRQEEMSEEERLVFMLYKHSLLLPLFYLKRLRHKAYIRQKDKLSMNESDTNKLL